VQISWTAFWLPAFVRVSIIGVVALLAGVRFGREWGWIALSLGLLILVIAQLRYLSALATWLRAPTPENMPDGWGAWETVFSELYRRERRETKTRERLRTMLERFRQGASALPDAMIAIGDKNEIEWANRAAIKLLNVDENRDRGNVLTNLVRDPALEIMLKPNNNGRGEPIEIDAPTGEERRLLLVLLPFEDAGRILLARDITSEKRTERMRRDFVANVSHELKTPLAVVGGFLEHLTDDPALPEDTRIRLYQLMREQSNRMVRLTQDLLVLSRLESDDLAPTDDTIRVQSFFQMLLKEAQALSAGKHNIQIKFEPAIIHGAMYELESAFSNLISNALRYSPQGGNILIEWKNPDSHLAQAGGVFSVTDEGVGISAEHIPRLTERFYRVDASRSRDNVVGGGGTGLGLAIVKHVIKHD
jgi:two-component system, OmpR family, phosphate regulon sensor histidine kinase PhoR